MKNLVSVIIPLYNAEKYIAETLDSVSAQTYQFWECLIIDDGSNDYSKKIVDEYLKKDKRFKYFYQTNSGPSAARNLGLKLSYGDYIQYLDADDFLFPNRLEIMLENSAKLDDNVILYSSMLLGSNANVRETKPFAHPMEIGKDVTFDDMYKRFALDFLINPSCLLIPRKATLNIKWTENLSYSEDWDYYLNILQHNYHFRYFPEPLIIYRDTFNSLSKNLIKTYEANYLILESWVSNKNLFVYSKRCALLLRKSIILYLTRKSKIIIKPRFSRKKVTVKVQLFKVLIYPITFFYILLDLYWFLMKRLKYLIKV